MVVDISRFQKKLIPNMQHTILTELKTFTKKEGLWICWAFPQQVPTGIVVSGTTLFYSIKDDEVPLFLKEFDKYYNEALKILKNRIEKDEEFSIVKFFGHDIVKWLTHIELFYKLCPKKTLTSKFLHFFYTLKYDL